MRVGPWCKHFQNNNWTPHDCDAKFALIGEAPGRVEDETGIPFAGKSGYDWESWIRENGLHRGLFYIDNCYPIRPPENKLFLIPKEDLRKSTEEMLTRLKRLTPTVIVPTGNTALRALFQDPKMNISDWRGSILSWNGIKTIPTLHPAVTQRQKVLTKLCVADWKRIATDGEFKELRIPLRKHIIDPSTTDLEHVFQNFKDYFNNSETELPPKTISVDVENDITSKQLLCVGFSIDPSWSITVSTVRGDYHGDDARFDAALGFIRRVLGEPWPVVGQNWMTDLWKLARAFPEIKSQLIDNYVWDLIELDHMLDPNDGGDTTEGSEYEGDGGIRIGMRDLGTLTSLYTRIPYYKYMSSDFRWEKRQVYCGLDVCATREIFNALWWKANERGLV